MDNLNVIDRFLDTFIRYIDSGFGLVNGDVGYLTTVLIGIDVTLAGLFWTLEGGSNMLGRLIKKILYVGVFALLIGNFSALADIIFRSFSTLGLRAGQGGMTAADLLRPGRLAGTGFEAAWPLLQQVKSLVGITTFFANFMTICVLLFAWLVVILSFFILATQFFITILEFKLTALAGFVLVPFALWSKTAFLAERVLGNVISSGVKVMVLAVIAGIGSGFFGDFVGALQGQEPSLNQAMSLVLASIALLGLGIFGPGIASGLVAGAPQLGAGAAMGTSGALAGAALIAGGASLGGARAIALGSGAALRVGTTMGAATLGAYGLAQSASGSRGMPGVGAGIGGVARLGSGAAKLGLQAAIRPATRSVDRGAAAGREIAVRSTGGSSTGATFAANADSTSPTSSSAPDWARRLRAEQRRRARGHTVTQAIKDGDKPASSASPDLADNER